MLRPWRRAFWGYKPQPADAYIDALEARIAERRQQRETTLKQLQGELKAAEAEVAEAEVALKRVEADYFRLAGELTTMAQRAQQTLEEVEASFRTRENATRADLDGRHRYAQTLSETIRAVPERIRRVIEDISSVIIGGSAPRQRGDTPPTSNDVSHNMPGRTGQSGV